MASQASPFPPTRALQISPSQVLFDGVKVGTAYEKEVHLTNLLATTVQVEVRHPHGDRYSVSPRTLSLEAGQTAPIRIKLKLSRPPTRASLPSAPPPGARPASRSPGTLRDVFTIKSDFFDQKFTVVIQPSGDMYMSGGGAAAMRTRGGNSRSPPARSKTDSHADVRIGPAGRPGDESELPAYVRELVDTWKARVRALETEASMLRGQLEPLASLQRAHDDAKGQIVDLTTHNLALQGKLDEQAQREAFCKEVEQRLQGEAPDFHQLLHDTMADERQQTEHKSQKVLQILAVKDDRIAELQKQLVDTQGGREAAEGRLREVHQNLDEVEKKQERLMQALQQCRKQFMQEGQLEDARKQIDELESDNKALRERQSQLERESRTKGDQVAQLKGEVARQTEQLDAAAAQLEEWQQKLTKHAQSHASDRAKWQDRIAEAEGALEHHRVEKVRAEKQLQQLRSKVEVDKARIATQTEPTAEEEEADRLREEISSLTLKLQHAHAQIDQHKLRASQVEQHATLDDSLQHIDSGALGGEEGGQQQLVAALNSRLQAAKMREQRLLKELKKAEARAEKTERELGTQVAHLEAQVKVPAMRSEATQTTDEASSWHPFEEFLSTRSSEFQALTHDLQTQVAALQHDKADLQRALERDVSERERQVSDLQTKLTLNTQTLEHEVDDHRSRCEGLKNQLAIREDEARHMAVDRDRHIDELTSHIKDLERTIQDRNRSILSLEKQKIAQESKTKERHLQLCQAVQSLDTIQKSIRQQQQQDGGQQSGDAPAPAAPAPPSPVLDVPSDISRLIDNMQDDNTVQPLPLSQPPDSSGAHTDLHDRLCSLSAQLLTHIHEQAVMERRLEMCQCDLSWQLAKEREGQERTARMDERLRAGERTERWLRSQLASTEKENAALREEVQMGRRRLADAQRTEERLTHENTTLNKQIEAWKSDLDSLHSTHLQSLQEERASHQSILSALHNPPPSLLPSPHTALVPLTEELVSISKQLDAGQLQQGIVDRWGELLVECGRRLAECEKRGVVKHVVAHLYEEELRVAREREAEAIRAQTLLKQQNQQLEHRLTVESPIQSSFLTRRCDMGERRIADLEKDLLTANRKLTEATFEAQCLGMENDTLRGEVEGLKHQLTRAELDKKETEMTARGVAEESVRAQHDEWRKEVIATAVSTLLSRTEALLPAEAADLLRQSEEGRITAELALKELTERNSLLSAHLDAKTYQIATLQAATPATHPQQPHPLPTRPSHSLRRLSVPALPSPHTETEGGDSTARSCPVTPPKSGGGVLERRAEAGMEAGVLKGRVWEVELMNEKLRGMLAERDMQLEREKAKTDVMGNELRIYRDKAERAAQAQTELERTKQQLTETQQWTERTCQLHQEELQSLRAAHSLRIQQLTTQQEADRTQHHTLARQSVADQIAQLQATIAERDSALKSSQTMIDRQQRALVACRSFLGQRGGGQEDGSTSTSPLLFDALMESIQRLAMVEMGSTVVTAVSHTSHSSTPIATPLTSQAEDDDTAKAAPRLQRKGRSASVTGGRRARTPMARSRSTTVVGQGERRRLEEMEGALQGQRQLILHLLGRGLREGGREVTMDMLFAAMEGIASALGRLETQLLQHQVDTLVTSTTTAAAAVHPPTTLLQHALALTRTIQMEIEHHRQTLKSHPIPPPPPPPPAPQERPLMVMRGTSPIRRTSSQPVGVLDDGSRGVLARRRVEGRDEPDLMRREDHEALLASHREAWQSRERELMARLRELLDTQKQLHGSFKATKQQLEETTAALHGSKRRESTLEQALQHSVQQPIQAPSPALPPPASPTNLATSFTQTPHPPVSLSRATQTHAAPPPALLVDRSVATVPLPVAAADRTVMTDAPSPPPMLIERAVSTGRPPEAISSHAQTDQPSPASARPTDVSEVALQTQPSTQDASVSTSALPSRPPHQPQTTQTDALPSPAPPPPIRAPLPSPACPPPSDRPTRSLSPHTRGAPPSSSRQYDSNKTTARDGEEVRERSPGREREVVREGGDGMEALEASLRAEQQKAGRLQAEVLLLQRLVASTATSAREKGLVQRTLAGREGDASAREEICALQRALAAMGQPRSDVSTDAVQHRQLIHLQNENAHLLARVDALQRSLRHLTNQNQRLTQHFRRRHSPPPPLQRAPAANRPKQQQKQTKAVAPKKRPQSAQRDKPASHAARRNRSASAEPPSSPAAAAAAMPLPPAQAAPRQDPQQSIELAHAVHEVVHLRRELGMALHRERVLGQQLDVWRQRMEDLMTRPPPPPPPTTAAPPALPAVRKVSDWCQTDSWAENDTQERLAGHRKEIKRLRGEVDTWKSRADAAKQKSASDDGEIAALRQKVMELQDQLRSARFDIQRKRQMIDGLKEKLAAIQAAPPSPPQQQQPRARPARRSPKGGDHFDDELDGLVDREQEDMEGLFGGSERNKLVRAHRELQRRDSMLEAVKGERDTLMKELETATHKVRELDEKLRAVRGEVGRKDGYLADVKRKAGQLEAEVCTRQEEIQRLRDKLQRCKHELDRRESQVEALQAKLDSLSRSPSQPAGFARRKKAPSPPSAAKDAPKPNKHSYHRRRAHSRPRVSGVQSDIEPDDPPAAPAPAPPLSAREAGAASSSSTEPHFDYRRCLREIVTRLSEDRGRDAASGDGGGAIVARRGEHDESVAESLRILRLAPHELDEFLDGGGEWEDGGRRRPPCVELEALMDGGEVAPVVQLITGLANN
ncbi:unnamed protein product [Vitrella brassicaformis CCMP3155]|uniref:MSP domain-containing protein n=4 Tax=Vitrella brassicaformis TaxID=1169539 RepID=A0A0G4GQA3_VITBC|nr:unnamed protein product [Vitrella brassicaformis CCMP3155]|eukprot:CEM32632.1 unnamed protein product [Vitrella brassicaformis CCMP3155]